MTEEERTRIAGVMRSNGMSEAAIDAALGSAAQAKAEFYDALRREIRERADREAAERREVLTRLLGWSNGGQ